MPTGSSPGGSAYGFSLIREKLRRRQGPTLDFALGRHREPPPGWLPRFVDEHAALAWSRRSDDELETLLDAAIGMLDRVYGVQVTRDRLLAAPSGRAAIAALAAVRVDPGDTVLVTEPGYPAFARLAAQRHATLAVVPLDPERQFAPDLGRLELPGNGAAVRVAAINYPNNPTGTVIEPPAFAALRQRLGEKTLVFNDATYGPLVFRRAPVSLLGSDYAGPGQAVIELHSLGKLFSIGPLGVAFLVGPRRLIAEINEYGDFAWTQLSSLQARTAAACLEDLEYLESRRDGLCGRIAALRDVVAGLGFVPYTSEAGMYLLCRAPSSVGGRRVTSAGDAADRLFEQHGLAIAPWDVEPHGYLRFSALFRAEDLDALAALGRIVD